MILSVSSKVFDVSVAGTPITIADTPYLRFVLDKLEVDKKTGDLAEFELPEPFYEKSKDLQDAPFTNRRLICPLPPYPTDLKEITRAWIISSADLFLDIWLQISRAFMTHLCDEPAAAGKPKP